MSENYIVSARKYRPVTFRSVVGQDHIVQTLLNSITTNHVAHAYLFTGPRGVGKTTCARILAKALNCENILPEGEPCGVCNSCKMFSDQRTFNIYELDAASNNSVEDIRALVDQVRYPPQNGKYKVYIIDEVHMLSQSAFNAFLKTLEEPPPYAIFILATTEKHKILPTIISRCQIFDFKRIRIKDIVNHLKYISAEENVKYEEDALHIIAQKSDGSLRDALSIFDRIVSFTGGNVSYNQVIENLNIIDYEYFFKTTDFILNSDSASCLLLFDKLFTAGFDGLNFLEGLSEHFRNLLVCKTPQTIELIELPETTKEKYVVQSEKTDLQVILSSLNILNQFSINYKESKNQRLHTELALIKLCYLKNAFSLSEQIKSLSQDQKKKLIDSDEIAPEPAPELAGNALVEENIPSAVDEKEPLSFIGNLSALKVKVANDTENNNNTAENHDPGLELMTEEKIEPELFLQAWNSYLQDNLKENKPNLYISLANRFPEFTDDQTVVIIVENAALAELLFKEKMSLVQYLRENFNIPSFILKIEVKPVTDEDKKKYMTNPREIYFEMVKENPNLEKLQRLLDLQIES